MVDEEKNETEQIASEEVVQTTTQELPPETETPVEIATTQQESPIIKPKGTVELNLRQLREKAEKAEREKEEMYRKMQQYEQSAKPVAQQQDNRSPETDYHINPDDLVEGKHLSKYDKKIADLEQRITNYQQQSTQVTMESQIKMQYPDFEKVVNEQTIADLKFADPDLAASIGSNPDILSKARAAYGAIKRLGIYQEDTSANERQKAALNSNKPRPLASVSPQQGDSPLSHANAFANGLTDELKLQLRKEMEEARKRL